MLLVVVLKNNNINKSPVAIIRSTTGVITPTTALLLGRLIKAGVEIILSSFITATYQPRFLGSWDRGRNCRNRYLP